MRQRREAAPEPAAGSGLPRPELVSANTCNVTLPGQVDFFVTPRTAARRSLGIIGRSVASWVSPLVRDPAADFQLINARTGAVVADSVAGAFDSETRRRGLLGRDGMAPGEALIIAPTNAIHTFFMRFAIDVAFVRRDGRIVKVRRAMGPWRIALALRAYAVVEMPAGAFASSSTGEGDTLALAARASA
jgi:uncharacterized membrane protein (UPF0127 family)